MDIAYLLWLQNLRNSTDNILTPFMEEVSLFAMTWLLFVPVFVYWCLNKRDGLFLFISSGISCLLNSVIKLTFCTLRPWMRDARVIPVKEALKTAGGFSFPSGHAMFASSIYGGAAVLCRKSAVIISWLCAALILITAFSRNYLGVHTPQDVVVGTGLGLLSIYITAKVIAYLEKHPERENMILIGGLVLCAASLVYVTTKSYPDNVINGGVDGINPATMLNGSFRNAGYFAGLIAGRFIERKFIGFKAAGLGLKGIALTLTGFVPYYYLTANLGGSYTWLVKPLTGTLGMHGGYFAFGFIITIYAAAVWPIVIKLFEGRSH